MQIHDDSTPQLTAAAVTFGSFDGFHLGHGRLVEELVHLSRSLKVPSVVITFRPHPAQVLRPGTGFRTLAPVEETAEQLARLGVDHFIVMKFTRELSGLSPEEFFEKHVATLGLRGLVVGYDFALGADRRGDRVFIENWGRQRAIPVVSVPPFEVDGKIVSSSWLRQLVQAGQMEEVARLLGRPFRLRGHLVPGAGRGKALGFGTANMDTSNETLPGLGVYLTQSVGGGGALVPGLTNIGTNPTFENGSVVKVETHFLAAMPEMHHGDPLLVDVLSFLRPEKKFGSPQELQAQIRLDIADANRYFKL